MPPKRKVDRSRTRVTSKKEKKRLSQQGTKITNKGIQRLATTAHNFQMSTAAITALKEHMYDAVLEMQIAATLCAQYYRTKTVSTWLLLAGLAKLGRKHLAPRARPRRRPRGRRH